MSKEKIKSGSHSIPGRQEASARVRSIVEIAINLEGKNINCDFITFDHLPSQKQHFAIGFPGWQKNKTPIVRIHTECVLGDVFQVCASSGDLELTKAIKKLSKTGGILLYIREGKNEMGLYGRLDSLIFEKKGLGALVRNQFRRFKVEDRQYLDASAMLRALKKKSIQLLERNLDKITPLELRGIRVLSFFESL